MIHISEETIFLIILGSTRWHEKLFRWVFTIKIFWKKRIIRSGKCSTFDSKNLCFPQKLQPAGLTLTKTGRKKLRSISALDYSCKKNFRTGRKNSKICVVISICTNFKKACYLPCVSVRFSAPWNNLFFLFS